MENYHIESDIKVMYITALSFSDGVETAHQKLHSRLNFNKNRRYFGISHPNGNVIVYKAAAEEIDENEAQALGLETFVIKGGVYISVLIPDFMSNIHQIGEVFQKLLSVPNIDPNGYCLEMYINNKDVRCMVGLKY